METVSCLPRRAGRVERSLNVGCGEDIRPPSEGWVNLDVIALPGVDVVHDLMEFPWPFDDNTFDYVLARHVMEHIPHRLPGRAKDGFLLFMEELHRILKPGGRVEIFSPHHRSEDQLADPTHTRAIHPRNFEYFVPGTAFSYYSAARFRTLVAEVSRRQVIARTALPIGRSRLGLMHHVSLRLPFLRRLLARSPAEIHIVLEKA